MKGDSMNDEMKESEKASKLYKMELHETINYDDFEVYRVPGGWVYRFFQDPRSCAIKAPPVDSVFVPWSREYDEDYR